MKRQNPPASAPMPKEEKDINNNSMKLFAYLMTIAGLADYPENTRLFRQKNLVLTRIYKATGITDKTVKLYLYYLEDNGLIEYKGEYKFNFHRYLEQDFEKFSQYRKTIERYAADIWKLRKTEKEAIYLIPRPMPYTPVPEITLTQLNEDFQISEMELDIYLFLCKYRDECVKNQKDYKAMTFENFRDILGLKQDNTTNQSIRNALAFLEKIKLISFSLGYIPNSKGAKIPCFKITDVGYYIGEPVIEFNEEETLTVSEKEELKRLNERIIDGYDKTLKRTT